ncbi:hypothetical protein DYBT9275_03961 [Dyadobacter sp. CECT 9275]|uniref:HTTM domain-containing protein n=1 Tax=Dyadobacter helix TaxID=2822344 RepID=A0A916NCW0_9BACT|nr:hypothetical protein [Dyadobacter sp. CECT 9275]CAG5007089.1 hypothetical protein DYBT9275_03961 [Dyadobacter sp. CECT 9275]
MPSNISAWLNNDYNPLDGRLRFLFYLLLLLVGYKELLIQIPEELYQCPQELYQPDGLFALIFGNMHSVSFMHGLLIYLKYPFLIFWIFSIIGLGGRLSLFCTAACLFIFWGAHSASSGSGHFWHVPLLIFIILAFTLKHDHYSIDFFLSRWINGYPFKGSGTDLSPFGRKLILIVLVHSLFSAGISKLSLGGLTWVNGHTLHYYLENLNLPRYYIGPILLKFLLTNFWLVTIISVLTILFELTSPVILFFPQFRVLFVILALFFHTSILLLMPPRFISQMICYLLIINWEDFFSVWKKKQSHLVKTLLLELPSGSARIPLTAYQKITNATAALVLIILLVSATIFKFEYFPLTNYPMYSSTMNEGKLSGIPLSEFNSYEGLKRLAIYCSDRPMPDLIPHYISRNKKCFVIKVNRHTLKKSNYTNTILNAIPTSTLWYTRLSRALLTDLRSSPLNLSDSIKEDAFPNSQRLLNAVVKKSLQSKDPETINCDFFLVYSFSEEKQAILAKYIGR